METTTTALHWAADQGDAVGLTWVDLLLSHLRSTSTSSSSSSAQHPTPPTSPASATTGGATALAGNNNEVPKSSSPSSIPLELPTHISHLPIPMRVDCRDAFGATPLHLAARGGHVRIVARLMRPDAKADPMTFDMFNRSPLWLAARHGRLEIVNLLLRAMSSWCEQREAASGEKPVGCLTRHVLTKTANGDSALTKAASYGHSSVVTVMLDACDRDATPNPADDATRSGESLLHICAARGNFELLSDLLEVYKASPNAVDVAGRTPLHVAIKYGHDRLVKKLLRSGANTMIADGQQSTPLDDAVRLKRRVSQEIADAQVDQRVRALKRECPPPQWTVEMVGQWARAIGFPQYVELFSDHDVDGAMLLGLTEKTLKSELGIESYGHRKDLVKHAKVLQPPSESTPVTLKQPSQLSTQERKSYARQQRLLRMSLEPSSEYYAMAKAHDSQSQQHREFQRIPYADLKIGELLGKGFFGEVRRASWGGHTDVAVKIIYRSTFGQPNEHGTLSTDDLNSELQILSQLRHPNVLSFLGASTDPGDGHCLIVTEWLPNGSLWSFIHFNPAGLDSQISLRLRIARDVCQGMSYLHGQRVLHRDLSTKNLLLDLNFKCVVCDFGLSRITSDSSAAGPLSSRAVTSLSLGCLPYQAPEVFRGDKYTPAADVFSFGMVCWSMLALCEPHEATGDDYDADQNDDGQALRFANAVAYKQHRPTIPDKWKGTFWQKLVSGCWSQARDQRPSFSQLLHQIEEVQHAPASSATTGTDSQSAGTGGVAGEYIS